MRTSLTRLSSTALFGLHAFLLSCSPTPNVKVHLEDRLDLLSKATYAELVVYEDDCPTLAILENGQTSHAVWRQSVSAADVQGGFSEIGKLDKSGYGFALFLRNEECGVLGFGCTPVNLEHHRDVTVAVNQQVVPPAGACKDGETCKDSICISGGDAGPLTCELELIATGKFQNPTVSDSSFVGPNVIATPTGFVVGYREASLTGSSRVIRLSFSDSGEQRVQSETPVNSCKESLSSDRLGMTWNSDFNGALMAVSHPPCGEVGKSHLHVLNFGSTGNLVLDHVYPVPPPQLDFSPVKSFAPIPNENNFYAVALTGDYVSLYVFINGLEVQTVPAPEVIQEGNGISFGQIATSKYIRSILTDSTVDEGKLNLVISDITKKVTGAAEFPRYTPTSLVAWDERTAVVHPVASALGWHVVDMKGTTIKEGSLPGGPFTAVDAAQLHDYLLIAGARENSITLFRFDEAGGALSNTSPFQTKLSGTFGETSLQGFDGARMAIAAARGRVVITWLITTEVIPGTSTAPGGYAILGCNG